MGPAETAIRERFTVLPETLFTIGQGKPFELEQLETEGILMRFGTSPTPRRVQWQAIEEVRELLLAATDCVPAAGTHQSTGTPGTVDGVLKLRSTTDTANYVVVVLREARIVDICAPRPLTVRLAGRSGTGTTTRSPATGSRRERSMSEPLDVCNAIGQWAEVAGVTTAAGPGAMAVGRSDLLKRLVYGGEAGPSETPCPVHRGVWSGLDSGSTGEHADPRAQALWDAGCRCGTHRGSAFATGWNPDRHCCAPDDEASQ